MLIQLGSDNRLGVRIEFMDGSGKDRIFSPKNKTLKIREQLMNVPTQGVNDSNPCSKETDTGAVGELEDNRKQSQANTYRLKLGNGALLQDDAAKK
jgi:hypothetical protein